MALLCVTIVIGVGVGPVYIGPGRVVETLWDGLMGNATTGTASTIVNDIRLPRVLVGAMVGAMMAMAGAILQGVTRNPLADPHILGVSAGAGLVARDIGRLGDLGHLSRVPAQDAQRMFRFSRAQH